MESDVLKTYKKIIMSNEWEKMMVKVKKIICAFAVALMCINFSLKISAADSNDFGQGRELTEIKESDLGNSDYGFYEYRGNVASAEKAVYYKNNGNLHVISANMDNQRLYDYEYNASFKLISKKNMKLPYNILGDIYVAPDNYIYIAVGQNNLKENDEQIVVKILKYDKSWKLKGTANINGGESNLFKGIYSPFEAGQADMTLQGNTLILHMARKMYKGNDGLRHQSNITFFINKNTMQLDKGTYYKPYASHSFNQFVRSANGYTYYVDHGDAYPRSVVMNAVNPSQAGREVDLFSIQGEIGDNYTGLTVNNFELSGNKGLIVGSSKPNNYEINGVKGNNSSMRSNICLITTNSNGDRNSFRWITKYNPNTSTTVVSEPKMLKIDENHFVILYGEEYNGANRLCYEGI